MGRVSRRLRERQLDLPMQARCALGMTRTPILNLHRHGNSAPPRNSGIVVCGNGPPCLTAGGPDTDGVDPDQRGQGPFRAIRAHRTESTMFTVHPGTRDGLRGGRASLRHGAGSRASVGRPPGIPPCPDRRGADPDGDGICRYGRRRCRLRPDHRVAGAGGSRSAAESRAGVSRLCERESLPISSEAATKLPSAEWRLETGDEPTWLAEHGRAADLLVVARGRDGEAGGMDLLEASLMTTGRPVLIASPKPPSRISGTVAIAWKNRREAARATAAAQPFLDLADRVIILSVDEGTGTDEASCDRLRHALSWHNANTIVKRLKGDGRRLSKLCWPLPPRRVRICW